MTRDLNPEIHKKIHVLISKNPGVHLSKIAEILSLPESDVEQYLFYLEEKEIVVYVEVKDYKKYYVAEGRMGFQTKKMLEVRGIIYDLVSKNPGLHLSKIAEMLNMRIPCAFYHLVKMEQDKKIIGEKNGKYYKRYYVEDNRLTDRDKKVLSLLRQEIPLKIVLFLLQNPGSRHKELREKLGLNTSTLTYHLHKLVRCDIVNSPTYKIKGYSIRNRKEIILYLKRYKIYTFVEYFKDLWSEF